MTPAAPDPIRAETLRLLARFTALHGVPGAEGDVRRAFVEELPDLRPATDGMGNLYFETGDNTAAAPRVMVTAHMDETGFMVQDVTPDGFLKFLPLGGWNENTLLAQRVTVRTRSGARLPGVISSVPPHFSGGDGRTVPTMDKLFVDIGAESRAQALGWGVSLGDPVAPESAFTPAAHPHRFIAKAFDNRSGCAALVRTLREIARETPPCRVVGVATVQEEVGCRGAAVAAPLARPSLAIVLEGPPADDTPGMPRHESQGALGSGVQIRMYDPSAIMNRELVEFARETATRLGIPHQLAVRRSGGTDAKVIHLANAGIPCVVLGVPARYIHTHAAMTDARDHEACVALTLAMLRGLTPAVAARFTSFLD